MPVKHCIIPLLFFVSFFANGQDLNYIQYNTNNGLPSSEVHDIYQDKRGYLWFATDRGLARFDGNSFKVYGLEDGLPGTVILRFYPQEDGRVWCNVLGNEIFELFPEEERIERYKYADSLVKYFGTGEIRSIVELEDKVLKISLVLSPGYSVINNSGEIEFVYNGDRLDKTSILNVQGKVDMSKSYFSVVAEWNNNQFFNYLSIMEKPRLEHDQSLHIRSNDMGQVHCKVYVDQDHVVFANFKELLFYKNKLLKQKFELTNAVARMGKVSGRLWVGFKDGGVGFYDVVGREQIKLLEGKTVTKVFKDHEGGYWFATISSGVFYVPQLGVSHHSFVQNGSVMNFDSRGEKLLVNTYGGGSYLVDRNGMELIHKSNLGIYGHFESSQSGDYLFKRGKMNTITHYSQDSERTLITSFCRNLSDDYYGPFVGIGSSTMLVFGEELQEFRPGNETNYNDVSWIEGSEYWLASRNGLYFFNTKTQAKELHSSPELNVWISEIDRIGRNQHLLGTKGNGVFILFGDAILKNIKKKDGLLSNIISEVYVENENTYWICTHMGLNRIQKINGRYKVDAFTTEDGLTNNDVTDVLVKNDTVWVGTKSGLDFFPVDLMDKERPKTKVFLEFLEARVNDVAKKNITELSYDQNKLDVSFKAISFRYKGRLRFRYRMEGLEKKWNYTSEQKVSYKSLPPGSYQLVIQAGVDDYWYNEEIRKKIYIAPPFYATWYFITSIVILIILIIYLFFRFRILSYNRYIIQEILRQIQRRLRIKDDTFIVRSDGTDVKVDSNHVLFAKAQGNYVELYTESKKLVIRAKISEFVGLVPDPQEYLQINRSTVIRKDKVSKKSKKMVVINDEEIKIGSTYKEVYEQLYL